MLLKLFTLAIVFQPSLVHAAHFVIGRTGDAPEQNNWPVGSEPDNSDDNIVTSNYANLSGAGSGLFLQFSTASTVNGLSITTGSDQTGADPTSFTLYAANRPTLPALGLALGTELGLSDFTQITSEALALPTARSTNAPDVTFGTQGSFNTYLLVFENLRDTDADRLQLSEVSLLRGEIDGDGNVTFLPLTPSTIEGGSVQTIPEPTTFWLTLAGLPFLVSRRLRLERN